MDLSQLQGILDQMKNADPLVIVLAAVLAFVYYRQRQKSPATPITAGTAFVAAVPTSTATSNLTASIDTFKNDLGAECNRFKSEVQRLVGGVTGEAAP